MCFRCSSHSSMSQDPSTSVCLFAFVLGSRQTIWFPQGAWLNQRGCIPRVPLSPSPRCYYHRLYPGTYKIHLQILKEVKLSYIFHTQLYYKSSTRHIIIPLIVVTYYARIKTIFLLCSHTPCFKNLTLKTKWKLTNHPVALSQVIAQGMS
jgi:hypothetical protein